MPEPLTQFTEVLESTLQVGPGVLQDTDSAETIGRWNSMVHMELITRLEKTFEVRFALTDVIRVKTIADLKSLLRGAGVDIPTEGSSS